MKNWRTTLAGLLAGLPITVDALLTAYQAGYFTGKDGKQLLIAVALILLGLMSKDKKVTGGTIQQ